MPTNTESLNRELFRLLSKYKPKPLDAEGKATPVPEEADIFKFEFTKDGEDYGTVYVTLDDERTLTVYFGDDVSDSPGDKTPGLDYDDTWSGLLHQLSSWRMTKGLRGFKTQNKDRVSDDMARRNHMRNKDKIAEGYYPMGKSRSYSDAVPSVKIVIEHSRVIEEGEQRYRNINRIFLENQDGERYLLDTKKPGIARVYARHIAEGGKVNDDRWSHIGNLCEEYQKMAGFVRATRNGQFNESAQALVNEGLEHYQSLRESLSRMTGKRGYNSYFESWTPPLMEDGTEENNLNELFVQETLDPRIESVMPILNRIHKKVSESVIDKEMNKLAEWADSLTEEESIKSNNPGGIPEGETSTHKGGTVTSKNGVTQHKSGPGVYGGYDASRHPDSPEEKHVNTRGATTGHRTDKVVKRKELDEFDIDTLNQLASHPMAGTLAAAGGAAIGATIGKGITKANDWYQKRKEEKALDRAAGVKEEEVDEGLDANQKRVGQLGPTEKVKNNNIGKLVGANENFINQASQAVTTEEDEGMFGRSKNDKRYLDKFDPTEVMNISDDPSKAHKTTGKGSLRTSKEDLEFAFGPPGEDDTWVLEFGNGLIATIYPQSNSGGMDWIIGGNHPDTEDFVHMAYSAALDDELEEGEHTQHAMRGRNPGANEFEHDFENDKIGNIHDKISKMLKRLEKPEHEPSMKDTDLGSTLHEVDTGEYDARKSTHKGETTPEQEKEFRKKVDTYGKELEQRQKEKVKEGQEDLDAILRIIRK
jgi:hypothetical protein